MKKIIVAILTLSFIFPSCSDLLVEENKTNAVSTYFNTRAGLEDALKGAYSQMRSFYGTERGMTLTVFGTDTYTNGSDGSWKFVNQHTAQLDARTGIIRELWTDIYRGINSANTVIDRAPIITGMDETLKNTRIAEARFLRAHFNFILVQMFGEIYLSSYETLTAVTEANRESVSSAYTAIVEDLNFAIATLPVGQPDWGRVTKPAAQHLLARVALTRATRDPSADPVEAYTLAAALSNSVINEYTYTLLPDYAKVFEQGAGEINSEVIWSIQYTNDPLTNGGGNNAHVLFLMEYDTQPGMQRDVLNGRPFKRFKPTDYTLGLWDRTIDSRYAKNFKSVFYTNKPGTFKINNRDVVLAAGDTAIWLPGYDIPADIANAKNYQVKTPAKYTEKLYPSLTKFLDPMRPDKTTFEGSRDFLAFRLAETYLIRAEALLFLNQPDEAADMLNAVRMRAAWPGQQDAMKILATDVTLDFILDERGRELLGEQFRWFDLVRTNKLVERVKLYNKQAQANIKDFHILRPIPQDQIDRTRNADGTSFGQNTGY